MKSNRYMYFISGVIITLLLFLGYVSFFKINNKKTEVDYQILQNQISHLNKMVTIEEDFSTIEKTTVSYEFFGKTISDNKIITHTKTNAQVFYDLNKMEIQIDSIKKKLIIKSLPKAEISIKPSVEITSMDDSFLNRIDEKQIKKVTKSAKENAINKFDKETLIKKANQQLLENLEQIFVLAKYLGYEIENNTNTILN